MFRSILIAILILAGGALLLCVLALRVLLSATLALSGIRRRAAHDVQLHNW